jgi:hypothetical protein
MKGDHLQDQSTTVPYQEGGNNLLIREETLLRLYCKYAFELEYLIFKSQLYIVFYLLSF